jgi:hypothetical protein
VLFAQIFASLATQLTRSTRQTDDGSVITLNIQPFVYQLRYSSDLPPNIYISSPPALGNAYSVAKARAVMVDTGRRIAGQTAREQRVSKVVLDNGGNGYTSAVNLNVFISPPGRGRPVLCGSGVVRASQANGERRRRGATDACERASECEESGGGALLAAVPRATLPRLKRVAGGLSGGDPPNPPCGRRGSGSGAVCGLRVVERPVAAGVARVLGSEREGGGAICRCWGRTCAR